MELNTVLTAVAIILSTTIICVLFSERIGLGGILGFITAGIIIGPHTPGPVPVQAVEELQSIAEFGVVLFLFTVGLEMRPKKVWSMRRLIFGLGSAQMLTTAAFIGAYLYWGFHASWQTALILGLTFGMSSTAIVMGSLGEKGELSTEHGKTIFSILMSQDIWVVPIMAMVPILGQQVSQGVSQPLWEKLALTGGVLIGIFVIGSYLLPALLSYCAQRRLMDIFGLTLLFTVILSVLAVEHVGISMTLGAFLLGMLLSGSDFRFQVEAIVSPFKTILMGLFFIAVGMSINIDILFQNWSSIIIHVPVVLAIKMLVLVGLVFLFGMKLPVAIQSGFYLSQVGELAFVLLGVSVVAGLLTPEGNSLAMLVVAISMISTPIMIKVGSRLATKFQTHPVTNAPQSSGDLERHVVVIGYDEVGQLLVLMLERAKIPHIIIEKDIRVVRQGRKLGREVIFGDIYRSTTQQTAQLEKASAVYITLGDVKDAKALSITLHQLYPRLDLYVRVRTLMDQDELALKGVNNAGTGYIESTLLRGGMLLKGIGVAENEVQELISDLQQNDYALIRSIYAKKQTTSN